MLAKYIYDKSCRALHFFPEGVLKSELFEVMRIFFKMTSQKRPSLKVLATKFQLQKWPLRNLSHIRAPFETKMSFKSFYNMEFGKGERSAIQSIKKKSSGIKKTLGSLLK